MKTDMHKLHYSRASFLNFGDDLNTWLWPRAVPNFFRNSSDGLLVGTGTILNDRIPMAGVRHVLGSGVGYGALPSNYDNSTWDFVFVRGPLTAKILDLPPDAAVADGAYSMPHFLPVRSGTDGDTIFIPHWKSDIQGDWQAVCDIAGIRYVSPRQRPEIVIREIAKSTLVLAESMHAAILADAYRVPWVPVQTNPEINDFKWLDFTLSVGIQHRPQIIPASGLYDAARAKRTLVRGSDEMFESAHRLDSSVQTQVGFEDSLVSAYRTKATKLSEEKPLSFWQKIAVRLPDSGGVIDGLSSSLLLARGRGRHIDRMHKEAAAEALILASSSEASLSEDTAHSRVTSRLLERINEFDRRFTI